jgi:6 kDa early secretory antigenic target
MGSGNDGTIQVASVDLEQMATDMKTANGQIQQRLDDLHATLMKIFGEDWKGAAQQAYTEAKQQWDTQVADMQAILADAHNNVITSRENYEASDKRAASFF